MTTVKKSAQPPAEPVLEPQDAAEGIVEDVVTDPPAGASLIKPVRAMRIRERKAALLGALEVLKQAGVEPDAAGSVEISTKNLEVGDLLELLANIDEFLEKRAIDAEAYACWATEEGGGPDLNGRVLDLFGWVVRRLGE